MVLSARFLIESESSSIASIMSWMNRGTSRSTAWRRVRAALMGQAVAQKRFSNALKLSISNSQTILVGIPAEEVRIYPVDNILLSK